MNLDRDQVAAALPGYEVGAELGRGGWGAVLAGRHRQLGRDVAIKQLPPAFANDPAVRARFIAEARMLASLDHPHVVPIYDYVEQDNVCLLVMENLPGGTVWHQFTTVGLTMPAVCAIVMATCAGLQSAHQKGILHRDVKPENLMFSATKTLKVTDFGISKVMNGSETKATRAGEVMGTPAYMAPEQVQNRDLSPATDVYAVGMMLYELLSGRLPFEASDPIALLFCQINDEPPPLGELAPAVPPGVASVTMKALRKDPTQRFATAEDLGVAVAEAATAAWGAGWLQQADVPVMATSRMAAVTQAGAGTQDLYSRTRGATVRPASPTVAPSQSTAAPPAGPTSAPSAPGPAPATAAPGSGPPPAPPAPATAAPKAPMSPLSTAPSVVVHSTAPRSHVAGASAVDMSDPDLVGIEEVVKLPAVPTVQVFSALAFLLVCLAVAFIGLGTPSSAKEVGDMATGAVTLGGLDPAGNQVIPLDLTQPVVVAGRLPTIPQPADKVKLALSVGGIPVGNVQASMTASPDGQFSVPLDMTGFRYLIANRTTARLTVSGEGKFLARDTFAVRNRQSSFLTVPAALGVAVLLFTLAYIESLLRSLRRRRKRTVGPVGLVFLGALVGVTAVWWAWLVAAVEPTETTMVVCALLGAAAGLTAALAAMRMGARHQMRRGR
ncbi:MAG: serine/threonine-protein kinase [Acidimicrobiales bacterium]